MLLLLLATLWLVSVQSNSGLPSSYNGCPICKEVLGTHPYSGLYSLVEEGVSICPDSCLYKDQSDQHFCFKPGGLQVRHCAKQTLQPSTTTTTTIPPSTTSVSLPITRDYFVLAGGSAKAGKSSTVGCYGEMGRMMDAPLLPADVVGGVGGVVGDLLLVCGSNTPKCWTWNPVGNTSEWVESAPFKDLIYPAGISVGGQFWVTGGMMVIPPAVDEDPEPEVNLLMAEDPGSGGSEEDQYNPYADMNISMPMKGRAVMDSTATFLYRANESTGLIEMSAGPHLTSQRWGHCATMLGGNVVFTGGVDFTVAGFYLALVEMYSLEAGYLSTLPSMNGKRLNHGCTTYPGVTGPTLIVSGGWFGGYIDTAEILQPSGTWVRVTPLPQMRNFLHMTVMNGAAHVIGGGQYDGGWQYRNTTLRYDPEENTWVEVEELSLGEGQILKHVLFTIPERLVQNTH
eukprot:GFUD01053314.1.p1 GENE.GFUD01053314.1~~GFUD01053314.1.p1  ORF type:complete len:455 (+),score=127.27 GFUD01053314.1:72-1436(+)